MRSVTYGELGQNDEALAAANRAWVGLPQDYREVTKVVTECLGVSVFSSCKPTAFQQAAIEAGGTKFGDFNLTSETTGFNNPAGLDMRPQTIAISIAAQRSLLYARAGDTANARSALPDLNKWMQRARGFSQIVFRQCTGPQFALGDYPAVIKAYHWIHLNQSLSSFTKSVATLNSVLYLGVPTLIDRATGVKDLRHFATALEETADELLN